MQMEHDRGYRISRGLGIFWFLNLIVACLRLYLNIRQLTDGNLDDKITIRSGIFFGNFALSLLMCILTNVSEPALLYQGKKPCPETSAGLLSLITFSWLNGLMALGFRRPLEDKVEFRQNEESFQARTFQWQHVYLIVVIRCNIFNGSQS